ncbi:HlyD family efflux transporter periplasmic adaptor subunit [Planctomycetaceae bacterium SH139]
MHDKDDHEPFRFSADAGIGVVDPGAGRSGVDAVVRETRQEIGRIIAEISSLAHSRTPEQRFWPRFLSLVGTAMAAEAVVLWGRRDGHWAARYRCGNMDRRLLEVSDGAQCHQAMIHEVGDSGGAVMVPPGADWESEEPGNPTAELAAVVPIPVDLDGPVETMLEVLIPAGSGPAAQRGYLRFIAQMADLAAEYLRDCRWRAADATVQWAIKADRLLIELGRLGPGGSRKRAELLGRAASFQRQLVDGVRSWSAAERVTLVELQGGHARVLAVSGVEQLDPHAALIKALSEIAHQASQQAVEPESSGLILARSAVDVNDRETGEHRTGETKHHGHDDWSGCGERSDAELETVVQEGHLVLRGVALLNDGSPRTSWCLVVEDDPERSAADYLAEPGELEQWRLMCGQLSLLLARWEGTTSTWWQFGGRSVAGQRSMLRRMLLPLGFLLTLCIAAMLPVPLVVTADGILQPRQQQIIYAPRDATVQTLYVVHGDRVSRGQPLVQLVDSGLDEQIRQLEGQIRVLDEQAADLETQLRNYTHDERGQVRGWQTELKVNRHQGKMLSSELEILRSQREELLLVSDREGTVNGWKLADQLASRPLRRGQLLLRVVEQTGGWQIDARVPQKRLDHVINANLAGASLSSDALANKPLAATAVLAAYPDQKFAAELTSLGPVLPSGSAGEEPSGTALFATEAAGLPVLEPGAPVVLAIDCGQKPLGYVVCQDLIRMLQTAVRLYW